MGVSHLLIRKLQHMMRKLWELMVLRYDLGRRRNQIQNVAWLWDNLFWLLEVSFSLGWFFYDPFSSTYFAQFKLNHEVIRIGSNHQISNILSLSFSSYPIYWEQDCHFGRDNLFVLERENSLSHSSLSSGQCFGHCWVLVISLSVKPPLHCPV